jgi:cytidine deaminase
MNELDGIRQYSSRGRQNLPEDSRPVSPMTYKQINSLLDHMNSMIDLRLARNVDGKPCICLQKMHHHIAMIFEDTGSHINPLSYGQNMARDNVSFHAEHNAIQKLKNRETKKLLPINIFVLKTTLTGVIGNSKPCSHCLGVMLTLPQKKGYKISNIYYTNTEGNIEKKKLNELLNEELHITRLFFDRGFKLRLSKN